MEIQSKPAPDSVSTIIFILSGFRSDFIAQFTSVILSFCHFVETSRTALNI
jgi:hypothetical protein